MNESITFVRRRAVAVVGLPFLVGCGAQGQEAAAPTAAAQSAPQAAPQAPQAEVAGVRVSGMQAFKVQPQQSQAIFRVREQLARIEFPTDAVGTTGAVDGRLAVRADGSIVSDDSKITVDLRTLATDSGQRDNFIKRNTLQTDQFPIAEFVPTRAEGLPSPLPETGEHSFKLTGLLTIHGVQKEVTWDTKAAHDGDHLTGTATTAVKFGDFGMEIPRVPVVLLVVDDIRLELNLVATREA